MKCKGELKLALKAPDADAIADAGFKPDTPVLLWIQDGGNMLGSPQICYDGQFVWFPVLLGPSARDYYYPAPDSQEWRSWRSTFSG